MVLVLLGRSLAFADGSDVRAFYVETDRADAVSRYDHLEFDGRYFIKTSLDKGIYEIEVGEKTREIHKRLTDIQWGRAEDPYGWTYRLV